MAGYSGTPLATKLGIKEGHTVALLGAPDDVTGLVVATLPPAVEVRTRAQGRADVVLACFTRRRDLERRVPAMLRLLDVDGGLWISWPKKASGVATDITEDTVRDVFLPLGLVDNKVAAIDDTWSGLRVVWRVERRAERRGTGAAPR
ncbi:MAG: hypothetical protein JWM05_2109 [Acidimicrobiales bacterium]|nr:hypothetical protein [Acidimicrobiales bacterium]